MGTSISERQMKILTRLRAAGQSLWLGHLSRKSIHDGLLMHAVQDWPVSGLAFSPQAIYQELSNADGYDSTIAGKLSEGLYGEPLAYSEIIEDVRYAADLLRPLYDRTNGADGWAVAPISPLSTAENKTLVSKYRQINLLVRRPNTLLCLPATPDRLPLIEELVFAGVNTNISNVYSDTQYRAAAKACLAGIERRLEAGLEPNMSLFITVNIARLESTLRQKTGGEQSAALTCCIARNTYRAMCELMTSREWERAYSAGAKPPRIVWSYCDIDNRVELDCGYYRSLIIPETVLALPHQMLTRDDDQLVDGASFSLDGSVSDQVLANSSQTGLDVEYEADRLQREYIGWLSKEWAILLENLARKSATVAPMGGLD